MLLKLPSVSIDAPTARKKRSAAGEVRNLSSQSVLTKMILIQGAKLNGTEHGLFTNPKETVKCALRKKKNKSTYINGPKAPR